MLELRTSKAEGEPYGEEQRTETKCTHFLPRIQRVYRIRAPVNVGLFLYQCHIVFLCVFNAKYLNRPMQIRDDRVLSLLGEEVLLVLEQQIFDLNAATKQQPQSKLVIELEIEGHLMKFECTSSDLLDVVNYRKTRVFDRPSDMFRCQFFFMMKISTWKTVVFLW